MISFLDALHTYKLTSDRDYGIEVYRRLLAANSKDSFFIRRFHSKYVAMDYVRIIESCIENLDQIFSILPPLFIQSDETLMLQCSPSFILFTFETGPIIPVVLSPMIPSVDDLISVYTVHSTIKVNARTAVDIFNL